MRRLPLFRAGFVEAEKLFSRPNPQPAPLGGIRYHLTEVHTWITRCSFLFRAHSRERAGTTAGIPAPHPCFADLNAMTPLSRKIRRVVAG
ncbi:MAG: hypothetical protein ACRD4C_01485 [Candidatus Acidiferrales bacterium]